MPNSAIKNRQKIIIITFEDLKTEKIINNIITLYFKGFSWEGTSSEINDLTNKTLGKINTICFTERLT